MKKIIITLCMIAIFSVLLTACNGKNTTITEDANGQTITLKKGETLEINIGGNPTTGYTWNLASVDETILKSMGEPEYSSSATLLVGSGGTYSFMFTAVSPGTTTLRLDYYRTFEKDVPPIDSFEITVVVE